MLHVATLALCHSALPLVDHVVSPVPAYDSPESYRPGSDGPAISRTGRFCAFRGSRRDGLFVCDVASRKVLFRVALGYAPQFTPDEAHLVVLRNIGNVPVTGSDGYLIDVFETRTGRRVRRIEFLDWKGSGSGGSPKTSYQITNDRLVLPNRGGPAPRVFNLFSGRHEGDLGTEQAVYVVVSRDGRRAAAIGRKGNLCVWNLATRSPVFSLDVITLLGGRLERRSYSPSAPALSADGRRLAVPIVGKGVVVFDVDSGAQRESLSLRLSKFPSAEFDDAGERLLFRAELGYLPLVKGFPGTEHLYYWDWKSGDRAHRFLITLPDGSAEAEPRAWFSPAAMTGDGRFFLGVAPGGRFGILDLTRAKPLLPAKKE